MQYRLEKKNNAQFTGTKLNNRPFSAGYCFVLDMVGG